MRWRIGAGLAALLCAASPGSVAACSLSGGALLPTNYELVQETETIVLARATDELALPDGSAGTRFTVVETLRGRYPGTAITLQGGPPFAGASPENDFSNARPGAYSGACTAFDYRIGGLYVLFLDHSSGRWDLRRDAFSRINEEVARINSPWVMAVRAYAKVADMGSYERRKAALLRLERNGDAALAADIARHFARPTPVKSASDLLQVYAGSQGAEDRGPVLWALESKSAEEVGPFFDRLLAGPTLPEWARGTVCFWAIQHPRPADAPDLLRQVLGQPQGQRAECLSALAALATVDNFDSLRVLLRALDDQEAAAFYSNADGLAHVEEVRAAIGRLLHGDYASAGELTATLARWGDPEALGWALSKVRQHGDALDVALRAITVSPLPHAELADVVDHSDKTTVELLLGELPGCSRDDRLELVEAALARFPGDKDVLHMARSTLRALVRDGVPAASSLLESLPVPAGDTY
ncbi:MAG: hypothetical protein ABI609_01480 [Acidobacteriota bacterium]